jgi:hypothetical protein
VQIRPGQIRPDGDEGDVATISGGVVTFAAPSGGSGSTAYMPLTTVVGGVPELVWDADDSLIPTEVTL